MLIRTDNKTREQQLEAKLAEVVSVVNGLIARVDALEAKAHTHGNRYTKSRSVQPLNGGSDAVQAEEEERPG